MLHIKKGSNGEKLTWNYLLIESNIYSASFTCNDGHFGSLLDHVILDNGRVEPSVVCTYEDCTFHDYITLDGWNSNGPKSEGYV